MRRCYDNNFNFPAAFREILALLEAAKALLAAGGCVNVVLGVAQTLREELSFLGISVGGGGDFDCDGAAGGEKVTPLRVAQELAAFRHRVRAAEGRAEVLALCDELRDELMPPLGFLLEDAVGDDVAAAAAG